MLSLFFSASDIALDQASPVVVSRTLPGYTTQIDDASDDDLTWDDIAHTTEIVPNKAVFLVGSEDDPQTVAWNDRLCVDDRPFLVITPGTTFSFIGPLVVPHSSACLRCLTTQIALGALPSNNKSSMEFDLSKLAWVQDQLLTLLEQIPLERFIGRRYRLDSNGVVTEDTLIARFYDCEGCRTRSRFPTEIYYATQLFPKE